MGGCKKSGSSFGPPSATTILPVAIAGEDFKKVVSSNVMLDGSKSYDPAGGTLTYQWTQTAGSPVTLSSSTVVSPTFTAPASQDVLTFQLTVTGAQGSDSASVTVTVKKFLVTAPDTWWVGYGKSGTLTATVTGTTSAPVYQWAGMTPWLTFSGDTTLSLSYTTPKLTDLQNFEDIATVAVFERSTQGRLQLTITVTDGADSDQDFVNFSPGPFADSVANENVAFGNPVFLNGAATNTSGAITSWTWNGTKPTGAAVSFFKPDKTALGAATDQRFVYFVPDKLGTYQIVGTYQITVTQNPGNIVKVLTINSGTYVGVGSLTGKTPDPLKGECAACHAGQLSFLADFANPWKQTAHAHVFENLLDPANPLHAPSQAKGSWKDTFDFGSDYSIDSRTVGWSQITTGAISGWTEQATSEGAVLKGTTWSEFVRKFPKTAGMSNVQCESCHGPGSEHAGDTAGIRKSYDSNVCGRCHTAKEDLWEVSAHADRTSTAFTSASGSASCNGCHTAQGFVVEMKAQQTADPHPVLFAYSNIDRPVIPIDDRRTQTCQACHDPHQPTVGLTATGYNPQLRAYGNVQFRNGAVFAAGRAAVCTVCHQSRTDARDNSADMNVRRAPHDSTAAEMLSGTNAIQFSGWTYNVSPHGIPSRFVSPGGENRQCLACHNDAQPGVGSIGHGALGGHTFNMTQGDGSVIATEATFGAATTTTGSTKLVVNGTQSFLKKIFPGDTILLDGAPNTVSSVESARQLTLGTAAAGATTTWSITSVKKYNTAACTQCHTTAVDFRDVARADYNGNGILEPVQDEIQGLLASLLTAINAKLAVLTGVANTLLIEGGRIKYTDGGSPAVKRTFPGPGVPLSENPTAWTSLTPAQQSDWLALYQAAYNYAFVLNDNSGGIHNTGYAVNLLQSAYRAATGTSIGAPFVPFP